VAKKTKKSTPARTYSTDRIKDLIPTWLTGATLAHFHDHYVPDADDYVLGEEERQDDLQRTRDALRLPATATEAVMRAAVTALVRDPKQWKRGDKARYGVDWAFEPDMAGTVNTAIAPTEQCWLRTFYPKSELIGDNYRIEVLTTADDTVLIGWSLVQD